MIAMNNAQKQAEKEKLEQSRRKHKGKKRKVNEEVYEELFDFDLATIKMFSTVNVNPPSKSEQLDDTIKKVEQQKQWYIDNGASKLQEQIEELKKANEEEDKEYEDMYTQGSQSAAAADYGQSRGKGRGRRDESPRQRTRGQRNFGPVNEFDGGDDDDDQTYAAPSRVQRKQGNKKEGLVQNEENFPAFGEK